MGKLDELLKEKPGVAVGVLVGFVLLISALGYVIYMQVAKPGGKKAAAVVEYADGQNTMTINRDGMVSIQTPYGAFSKTLSAEELAQLFAYANGADENCQADTTGVEVVVEVTYDDGTEVECLLEELDEAVSTQLQSRLLRAYEEYQLMPTWQHDIFLGQIQKTGEGYTPIVTPTPSPTPSPAVPGASATPSPAAYVEAAGCEDITDEDQRRKTVVSNVLCVDNQYQD